MSIPITLHLITVLPAIVLGCFILTATKGTPLHKLMGRIWAGLMLFTSAVSFLITDEGAYSWIHILSCVTIISVLIAIVSIRQSNVKRHQYFMVGAFIGALIAGFFATIMPGRVVYEFLFT